MPTDALHRAIAKKAKALMVQRGLSVNHLADFSGLGRGHLSDILAAKSSPTVRSLAKIADALEVQVRDLFPEE